MRAKFEPLDPCLDRYLGWAGRSCIFPGSPPVSVSFLLEKTVVVEEQLAGRAFYLVGHEKHGVSIVPDKVFGVVPCSPALQHPRWCDDDVTRFEGFLAIRARFRGLYHRHAIERVRHAQVARMLQEIVRDVPCHAVEDDLLVL